jgi:hypothetical protein
MSIEFENFISNWKKGKGRGKEKRKEKVNPAACLA